jgi:DNA-directed RNA polymerase I subunit RPA49
MSKWHVDKLIMHICALTLHIDDNFETDFNDLRDDLRLDVRQMTQYYHELGCKVASLTEREKERMGVAKSEAAQHRMAKLRLPLEFPKQRVAQRKRR